MRRPFIRNALYVLVLASWLFGASAAKRFILPLMLPLVTITYIATQRRAAFASLGMMIALMTMILYRKNRRLFWTIVPTVGFFTLLYLAVFWNSGSALAFGARAVKSIVAPDAGSADESSNLYRVLENINIGYTIHLSPLLGVGFGQKFHITVAMPDISFFVWWEYIVHNSVFWIWMKSGLPGFMTVLILMGFSLMRGGRMVWRIRDNDLQAIAFTLTAYLFMHYMYAYVDMSWDPQSMLFVGTALGLIDCLERIDTVDRWVAPVSKWQRYQSKHAPHQVAAAL
ncbi:MAG: O-antigen ligase family protein [Caldilineaceae bacterium]